MAGCQPNAARFSHNRTVCRNCGPDPPVRGRPPGRPSRLDEIDPVAKSGSRGTRADQDSPPFVKVFSKGRCPFFQMGALPPKPLGFIAFGPTGPAGGDCQDRPRPVGTWVSAQVASLRCPILCPSDFQFIQSWHTYLQLTLVACPFPRRSGSYNVPAFSIAISTASQRSATPRVARP